MLTHAILFACIALTPQVEQAAQRETRRGRVVDESGTPWANASLTFVWQPSPDLDSVRDVVRVSADEDGRFEARLLVGRDYQGYARSRPDKGRIRWAAAFVRPKQPIQWRDWVTSVPETICAKIDGLEAWKSRAPLRFFITTQQGWREEVTPGPDGAITIPPRWGYSVALNIVGRDGTPIADRRVDLNYPGWKKRQPKGSLDGVAPGEFAPAFARPRFSIGAPYRLRLRVVGGDGDPVPAAGVFIEGPPGKLHRIATTEQNGIADVVLGAITDIPYPRFEQSSLRIQARGHVDTSFSISRILSSRAGNASDEAVDVRLEDRRAFVIRGRLLLAEGQPAARSPLLLFSQFVRGTSHNGSARPVQVLETDEDGRFAIHHRDPQAAYALTAILLPRHRALLPSNPRYPLADTAILSVCRHPDGQRLDLGEVRLDQLRAIDLQVLSADNLPVRSPWVLIGLGRGRGRDRLHSPQIMLANGVGRIRLLLPHRDRLTLAVAADDHGYKAMHLDELPDNQPSTSLRLRFDPLLEVSGRLVDDNGNAKRNVLVYLSVDDEVRSDLSRLYRFVHLGKMQMKTDDRGRFRFRAVARRGYMLYALFEHAPDDWRFKDISKIDLGSDPIDGLELVLDSKLVWERKDGK